MAVSALGLTTAMTASVWNSGCSDTTPGGTPYVDPGGTFGAELSVTVKGRGRVITTVPGLDCPSDCFSKTIYASSTADGAAGGITLRAIPTPGSKFRGWSFANDPVGTRGRGPEPCNPITRPGTTPSVDTSGVEITLPFGEIAGTPPAGKEATCAIYTTVPIVYAIVAEFDGSDVVVTPDGGGDGGVNEIAFNAPTGASTTGTPTDIGIAAGLQVFWRFLSTTGYYGVATGAADDVAGLTPQVVVSPSSTTSVNQFEVDSNGAIWQNALGIFYAPYNAPTAPTQMGGGSVGTCSALAADSTDNVYCRVGTSLYKWTAPAYALPQLLFTNLPTGSDLAVETNSGEAYFSGSSAVYSISTFMADGGFASPTTLTTSTFSNNSLESNTSYLWWISSSALYRGAKTVGGTPINTLSSVTPSATVSRFALDPASSLYAYAATSSGTIYRAYYNGGTTSQVFKSNLGTIGGVAVSSQYVYWTEPGGRVRRADKNML